MISAIEVEDKLEGLDELKGPGPDNIPPAVLKYCSSVLAPHLTLHFNNLFSAGVFPSALKSGFLVPIYKAGDRGSVMNYRPIVILFALSKVLESLILKGLEFELKGLIIEEQHGFRPGRSTTSNLITFQDFVILAFSRGNQVDCIYIDFSKAFDRVVYLLLIAKLRALGVCGPLLSFIASYLKDRTLIVRYLLLLSNPILVTSGVPQGSRMGPFLFIIFINDIAKVLGLKIKYLIFADDVKLFIEVSSQEDQLLLQELLRRIEDWCKENMMELNVSKCAVMSFTRSRLLCYDYRMGETPLRRVFNMKDLGVVTNPTLHPGDHIHTICAKANATLGYVFRSSKHFSISTLRTLFVTLVRPLLEYGAPVWNPYQLGLISALERVQNRFLRLVGCRMGYGYLDVPLKTIRDYLHLQTLEERRNFLDMLFLYKLAHGLIDSPYLLSKLQFHVPRGTRTHQVFERLQYATNYQQNSTMPRLMRHANKYCQHLDLFGNINSFKRDLASLLSVDE